MGICCQAIFGKKGVQKTDEIFIEELIDNISLYASTNNDKEFTYYQNFFQMELLLQKLLKASQKEEKRESSVVDAIASKFQFAEQLKFEKQSLERYLDCLNIDKEGNPIVNKLKEVSQKIIEYKKSKDQNNREVCLVKFEIQDYVFSTKIEKISISVEQILDIQRKQKSKSKPQINEKQIGVFTVISNISTTIKKSMHSDISSEFPGGESTKQIQRQMLSPISFKFYEIICPVNSLIIIKAICSDSKKVLSATIDVADISQNIAILQKFNFKVGVKNVGVMGVRVESIMSENAQRRKIVQFLSLRKFQLGRIMDENKKGWEGLFSQAISSREKGSSLMSEYDNPYAL